MYFTTAHRVEVLGRGRVKDDPINPSLFRYYGSLNLNAPDPLELLKKMITFKTVSLNVDSEEVKVYGPEFKRFAEFLKDVLSPCADEVKVVKVDDNYRKERCPANYDRYIVYARRGKPILEFNGHYDVVPPGGGWTRDPFVPIVEGDRIYGRGSNDMKGGLAAAVSAFCQLEDVSLVAVPDEEIGGECGTKYRIERMSEPIPDYVIVAEPSDLRIKIGHKGALWAWASFKGKQAHASTPWLGENAFVKAAKAIPVIEQRLLDSFRSVYSKYDYSDNHPLAKTVTYNIGGSVKVSTSNFNSVPGEAKISIDVRLIPEVKVEEVRKVLKEAVEGVGGTYEEVISMEAYVVDEKSPVVIAFQEVLREEGLPTNLFLTTGGTDQRFYGEVGKDAIMLGPGSLDVAHKPDEWNSISQIYKAVEIYVKGTQKLKEILGKSTSP